MMAIFFSYPSINLGSGGFLAPATSNFLKPKGINDKKYYYFYKRKKKLFYTDISFPTTNITLLHINNFVNLFKTLKLFV